MKKWIFGAGFVVLAVLATWGAYEFLYDMLSKSKDDKVSKCAQSTAGTVTAVLVTIVLMIVFSNKPKTKKETRP